MTKAFELAELANIANVDVLANTLTFNTALSLPSINASALTGTVPPSTLPQANSTSNGAVLILDSVANTSIAIYAASANSVKTAYDAAIAANTRASSAQTAATSAYSNATSYANTAAGTAYSNAVSTAATDASSKAATAYSNATAYADTKAATAYSNATAYADTKAATAYSNATSYSDTSAATAYTNAVAYAASNSYVNSTFLKLSGGTMTGSLTVSNTISVGNTTITGVANVTANLAANNATLRGSLQIDGNLYVSGTTVTINAVSLAVGDNMIYLNANSATANPDLGFAGNYNDGTYRHAGFFRDATDGVFKVFDQYVPEPDASAYIDTSNNTFRIADFQSNNTTLGTANVVGALAARSTATVNGAFTVSNTAALGNTTITGFANVTSTIQGGSSLTIAGALSGVTTAAMGNTTITGFANVSSTLQVGTNTATFGTAAYHVANGNFGLGTSSPGSKLDVQGSGSGVASFTSTSSSYPLKLAGSATTTAGYIGMSTDSMVFYVNSADRVLIDTSGNVGVGTNAPENKLTLIKNTTAATENSYAISIQSINTNAYTELLIGASDAVDAGIIQTAAKNTNFTGKNLALQPQGGSVGIGTTSPATGLDVYKAPDANWGSASFFDPTTTAAGVGGVITLGGYKIGTTNKSIFAKIQGAKENATSGNEAGYLAFITNNNSAYVERARFDSSGNFAIGRTTAGATLDIESSAGASTYWRRTTYANRGTFNVDGTNATVASEGALLFGAGSGFTERARITSAGNFGIGTTTVGSRLTLYGNETGDQGITFLHLNSGNNTSAYPFLASVNGTTVSSSTYGWLFVNSSTNGNFELYRKSNSTTASAVLTATRNDGYVGIGTTSPAYRTDIASSTGYDTTSESATVLRVRSTSSRYPTFPGETTAIAITKSGEPYGWRILSQYVSDTYAGANFHIQNSLDVTPTWGTKFFIDPSGSVGIGTSSPAGRLTVAGTTSGQPGITVITDDNSYQPNITQYKWTGTGSNYYGTRIYSSSTGATAGALYFQNAGPTTIGSHSWTTRMLLDDSGNLGLGVTPSGWGTGYKVIDLNTGGAVYGTTNGITIASNLYYDGTNWKTKTTDYGTLLATYGGQFLFYNSPSATAGTNASLYERVRIDTSGNVGIGTTSPANLLHVGGGVNDGRIQITNNARGNAYGNGVWIGVDSAQTYILSRDSVPLTFFTNGTERARITSTGNVLIGTSTSYGGMMTIIPTGGNPTSASSTLSQLQIGEASVNTNYRLNLGYAYIGSAYYGSIQSIAGGAAGPLLLNADGGNVGIGTTSPGYKVDVLGTSDTYLRVIGAAGTTKGGVIVGNNDSAKDYGKLYWDNASNLLYLGHYYTSGGLVFVTNSTEKARLDTSGNFGIGTTSPSSSLHIVKGNGLIRLDNGDGNYSTWQQTGSDTRFGTQSVIPLTFYTNTTERARIDTAGNMGINTTSPATRLDVRGTDAYSTLVSNTSLNDNTSTVARFSFATDPGAGITSGTGAAISISSVPNRGEVFLVATNNGTSKDASDFTVWTTTGAVAYERTRLTSNGKFLVGTTTESSESNIALGAQGTVEGGQIVLQKGTSQTYASHIDNYTDSFRIMAGTDSTSATEQFRLAHGTGNLSVIGVYSATVGGTNRDVYVDNGGLLGYVSSVRASKTNIVNLTDVSWLLDLVPVSFNRRKKDEQGSYTDETEGTTEYGLIAEETEAVKPELCFYDEVDGNQELRGISYSKLITPMLKLIQDQQDTIDELRSRVAQLEDKLN